MTDTGLMETTQPEGVHDHFAENDVRSLRTIWD